MTEQEFRPSTSKPERGTSWRGMAAWGYVIGIIGIIVTATGLIFLVSDDDAPKPSSECVAALDAADALVDAAADSFGLIAQALDALSQFDLDRVEYLADQLDAGEVRELRSDYDDKAKECRGG